MREEFRQRDSSFRALRLLLSLSTDYTASHAPAEGFSCSGFDPKP